MRLPFELDPGIIHHIIHSQAGSIGKAIIELIMNSVDAEAKVVRLTMTRAGFTCRDDGRGFASRADVKRYFGRFGTPHQEGDATFGRFRLGRGQIMAHATTQWRSSRWMMTVDTQAMGYAYDLDPLPASKAVLGCEIVGEWYEQLSDTELLSATQEIRDLVRYTPVTVELNERVISRDPRSEKWDYEDEHAWYRVRIDGAVSIFNQGVMVRRDESQQWGAGGVIVSKMAIGLNVSRTEILRKTCPVWQPISKQFGAMARDISAQLGANRKTEASREKAAHGLLAGEDNFFATFANGEVITLLPGKRHLTLLDFLYRGSGAVAVVENAFDVPKGECIAHERLARLVHPSTLWRFNCEDATDFQDVLERILSTALERWSALTEVEQGATGIGGYKLTRLRMPAFTDFQTLRDAFVDRSKIVQANDVLDTETKRAWTAMKWCLGRYVRKCEESISSAWRPRKHILLAESNMAEAWTDGETYIAFNADIVKQLRQTPMETASRLFSVAEHEVAHAGDSIDCGHDEAFYQRFHDISISMASERQRHMQFFLKKYVTSMESEGRRNRGRMFSAQYLVDRANKGRQKRDLTPVIADLTPMLLQMKDPAPESVGFCASINAQLAERGLLPKEENWAKVVHDAQSAHTHRAEKLRQQRAAWAARAAENDADQQAWTESEETRILGILGVEKSEVDSRAWLYLWAEPEANIRETYADRPWMDPWEHLTDDEWDAICGPSGPSEQDERASDEQQRKDLVSEESERERKQHDPASTIQLLNGRYRRTAEGQDWVLEPGETMWSLERNAAAAGFFHVPDYLAWRESENVESGGSA